MQRGPFGNGSTRHRRPQLIVACSVGLLAAYVAACSAGALFLSAASGSYAPGLLGRAARSPGRRGLAVATAAIPRGIVGEKTAEVYAAVAEQEPTTVTLQPGPLGVELDIDTGKVKQVMDGAAKDGGVQPGWVFKALDGEPYDLATLKEKIGGDSPYEVAANTITMPNPTAVFDTSMGVIKAEIYLDRVPATASNFINLADSGFYNGIHFHRVIPGFMNQFGCPYAKDPKSEVAGTGGPDLGLYRNLVNGAMENRLGGGGQGNIRDEFVSEDSNEPGTLSMANTGEPNSGGSQFFMNVANNDRLDWFSKGPSKHPVFGKITEGYDVCKQISEVPTEDDNPVDPIMMKSITIEWP